MSVDTKLEAYDYAIRALDRAEYDVRIQRLCNAGGCCEVVAFAIYRTVRRGGRGRLGPWRKYCARHAAELAERTGLQLPASGS